MVAQTDLFNRTNGPLGSNWAEMSWSDQTTEVINNTAKRPEDGASGNSFHRWVGGGSWGREQYSEVNILSGDRGGPCVYMTDANGCYYIRFRTSNGFAEFMKVPNTGGDGVLINQFIVGSFVSGDPIGLKAEDNGSGDTLLTLYHNGSAVDTHTDTTGPLTAGDVGFGLELYWRTAHDSWQGDDFVTGVITSVVTSPETEGATAVTAQLSTIVTALAGAETETALPSTPQIAAKVASFAIKDTAGQVVPEQTGIQWWSRDARNAAPTDSTDDAGQLTSSDAIGEVSIELANTTKVVGEIVYVECELQDGRYGIYEATVS